MLEGVQLDEPTEAKAEEPKPPALSKGAKGWWESNESDQESERPIPWWARPGEPVPQAFTEKTVRRERERWRRQEAAKRLALARAKRDRKIQELEEQRLLEAGGLDELKRKKEELAQRAAELNEVRERGKRRIEQYQRNAAERKEIEEISHKHAKKRSTLARVKRDRTKREQDEQQRLASGQWEREKVRKQQAAARTALENLIHERAEQEREERRRYAMAQAEAEQRRNALLTQMFLVTSSVAEPRRTEAGNRDLLNSSITALFSLKESEVATEVETDSSITGYFLAELFEPPVKEEPLTLDAEFVSVEEEASLESPIPAQVAGVDADQREPSADTVSHFKSKKEALWYESTSPSFASSSSASPDYTIGTASNYQPVSAYTDCQLQNMQMAAYQHAGAAQTQASQQANPPPSPTTTTCYTTYQKT